MKNLITKTLILTGLFFLMVNISCEKQDEQTDPELPDISIVDISQESEWDYWVVGKKDYYYIKTENDIPRTVLYHASESDKDYSIFIAENGQLDKVVVDDYIFVFKNFVGSIVDIGIIYPDGEIEILREVETGYDWEDVGKKSFDNQKDWRSFIVRVAARTAAGVPCALAVAATIATHGAGIPLVGFACSSFLLKLSGDIAEHDFDVHNGFTEFANTYGWAYTATHCHTGEYLTCITGAASKALHKWANHLERVENGEDEIRATEGTLENGNGDVQINLTWDNYTDLDLHVIDPTGEEIYFGHSTSASGGYLDVDDINGLGPENIFWPTGQAPYGIYSVYVNHYSGSSSSHYTVIVIAFGHTKTYSGNVSPNQKVHIADFDQNGIYDGKKSTDLVKLSFKVKEK